jgi:hypothetical protein
MRPFKATIAALGLLWGASLFAQTNSPVVPVQVVLTPVNGNQPSVYNITVPPCQAGDFQFIYGFFSAPFTLSDSQGNTWIQVNSDYRAAFYDSACKGGPETYTVTFGGPAYFVGIYYEFSGSYTLSDVIPSRSATNGQQSLNYITSGTNPCALPLTISNSNELVINYYDAANMASLTASQVTPGPGWNLGAFVDRFFAQGTIVASPGTITGCVTTPAITPATQITAGIAGFKPISLPQLNTVTLNLNFSYEDGTAPTIYQISVADTTTNAAPLTLTPSPTASGTFTLSSTDMYSVTFLVAGAAEATLPYQGSLVLALFPNISQITDTIVLCKTTCTAGAIKSLAQTVQ